MRRGMKTREALGGLNLSIVRLKYERLTDLSLKLKMLFVPYTEGFQPDRRDHTTAQGHSRRFSDNLT